MPSFSRRLTIAAAVVATVANVALVTSSGATTLTSLQGPLPANTMPAVNANLNGIDCTSTTSCVAVGRYESTAGGGRALVDTDLGGSWRAATTITLPPNAVGFANGVLNGVSCVSTGNCVAVGQYQSTGGYRAMIVTESGSVWHRAIQSPLPAGSVNSTVTALNAVSCVKATSCLAVGQFTNADGDQGFSVTLTGATWGHARVATLPPRAKSNFITQLDGVSCVAVGYCVAVGEYVNTDPAREGMILTEAKGVWKSSVKAPLPANAESDPWAGLYAVSCVTWGNCEAVGVYRDAGGGQGVTLRESGGHWATGVDAPLPAGQSGATKADQLLGVSCKTAGDCVAVGMFTSGGDDQGVVLVETNGHWARGLLVPRPGNAISPPYGIANAVSCAAVGHCALVGQYQSSTGEPSLITQF